MIPLGRWRLELEDGRVFEHLRSTWRVYSISRGAIVPVREVKAGQAIRFGFGGGPEQMGVVRKCEPEDES